MSEPGSGPSIEQRIRGNKNISTGTGDVYIYNYPTTPPVNEVLEPSKEEIPPCPYKGLFAFRPEDTDLFFGREKTTERLLQATLTHNFVALIGASGSGKSSVVYAGLIPQLHQQQPCLLTYFRPTDAPFLSLARALLPLYDPDLTETDRLVEAKKLAKHFLQGDVCISDIVARIHDTRPEQRVLLIADQFEELYTLSPDPQIHHKLIDLLLAGLLSDLKNSLNIILTMRADFMGDAIAYRPFADVLQENTVILGPMTREELSSAVIEPATKRGVEFENELVSRILNDVGTEPGQLPLLEFALTELWSHQKNRILTHDAYSKIGEVGGALGDYVETVYTSLNEMEQHSAKLILLKLVRSNPDAADTRRLATRDEIEKGDWNLVAKLASKRLVVTSVGEDGKERFELIHETIIRTWGRLTEWLDEDREFRLWNNRLHSSLLLWKMNNKKQGALLQGIELTNSKQKIKDHSEKLNEEERRYIRTSVKWSRLKQISLVTSILGLVLILVIAITLGVTGQLNRFIYKPLPMEWVEIGAGTFLMGSSEADIREIWEIDDRYAVHNEQPQHLVYLGTFAIGKYEVTNEQYRQCVLAGVCNTPSDNPLYENEQYNEYPVVGVNWKEAQTFCEWNGGRLPTEAEWEKAARGPETKPDDTRSYPWDGEWNSANANVDDKARGVQRIGSYSPSGDSFYGAADMSGNVWEWVMDWYSDYEKQNQLQKNPTGPEQGEYRILRGGSFENSIIEARSTYRLSYLPGIVYPDIGFRCTRGDNQ